ncbi:MAG: response regulator transcription factor [Mangrovibacterium sp.]
MEEQLFIIHPSAIVRRGLTSIVQEFFKFEITQLNCAEELNPFGGIANKVLLVLAEENENIPSRLAEQNQIVFIRLADSPIEKGFGISLRHDDALQIQQTIQLARNSVNKVKSTTPTINEELTQREIDVLRQIAIGLANKEIADTLCISIHTVISHRKNIIEKLNIKTISGLTVYAIMNKLVDIEEIKM